MGNLDFTNQPGFSWYCVLLLVSGIAMLGMIGIPMQSKGSRIANIVFGIGFTCYAVYLIFLFHGGTYFIFFKAFILPIVLIVGTIKSAADARRRKNAAPYAPPVMNYAPGAQPQSPWTAQLAQPQVPQPTGAVADQPAASAPQQPPQG